MCVVCAGEDDLFNIIVCVACVCKCTFCVYYAGHTVQFATSISDRLLGAFSYCWFGMGSMMGGERPNRSQKQHLFEARVQTTPTVCRTAARVWHVCASEHFALGVGSVCICGARKSNDYRTSVGFGMMYAVCGIGMLLQQQQPRKPRSFLRQTLTPPPLRLTFAHTTRKIAETRRSAHGTDGIVSAQQHSNTGHITHCYAVQCVCVCVKSGAKMYVFFVRNRRVAMRRDR